MRAAKTWKTWTAKESDRLEALRLAGKTVREIAAELGRSRPSVVCQLARLGVRKPRAAWERWAKALTEPHTARALAARFKVKVGTVKAMRYRLRQAGFDIPAARGRKG